MNGPLHDVWSCADGAGHEETGHVFGVGATDRVVAASVISNGQWSVASIGSEISINLNTDLKGLLMIDQILGL